MMKFDTVIIGGGLAGLVCGIRLVEKGQRCVIISSGQSALHFSSGSFDLLNKIDEDKEVLKPIDAIASLIKEKPKHPYSKMGVEAFESLSKEAKAFLKHVGIEVQGDGVNNHYRITPMGTLKSTWLTINDFAISEEKDKLPWKRVAIFNVTGFLDFYPRFIADEFVKYGTESDIHLFTLPDIDRLRRNPTEMRATNIAWALDKENNKQELIKILKEKSEGCDAIVFPAIIGMQNHKMLDELEAAVGKPINLLPTLPPSIVGIRAQRHLHDYFLQKGGIYMLGDNVMKADMGTNKIDKIYSFNHQDIPFVADNYVLATGSYFSQGLIATQEKIVEPIFDLDVDETESRQDWYQPNMFEKQNYQSFGVKTDKNFHAQLKGQTIDNLYVSGAILEGFDAIKEGSGGGVSILSALHVANQILSK